MKLINLKTKATKKKQKYKHVQDISVSAVF